MKVRTSVAALSLTILTLPAFASGVIHNANTEVGYTTHPDHAITGLTRAHVIAELQAAQRSPDWSLLRLGISPTKFESRLTRAEVLADLLRAQQDPTWEGRRFGVPVSMN
ncbi:MAG: DUF4148 domain-containing protein [Caldisericota bacterium]|nr:DUF4148 domain-containing protein [Caldisericota bacterium]